MQAINKHNACSAHIVCACVHACMDLQILYGSMCDVAPDAFLLDGIPLTVLVSHSDTIFFEFNNWHLGFISIEHVFKAGLPPSHSIISIIMAPLVAMECHMAVDRLEDV